MGGIRDELEREARKRGFSLLGVADPDLFDRHPGVVSVSPSREFMHKPGEVLPGCRSVIVVGLECREPVLDAMVDTDTLLATFYDEIIFSRLGRLRDWLESRGATAAATDLISLKRAAVLAGLGLTSRNTLVVAPGLGSDVRWGALLTDLALPYDEPNDPFESDPACRECERCVKACPSGAIGEYAVDFGECLVPALGLDPPGSERYQLAYEVQRRLGPNSHCECTICLRVCPLNGTPGR